MTGIMTLLIYECIITLLTKVLKISQFGFGYGFNSILFDFSIVPTRVETVPYTRYPSFDSILPWNHSA